MSLILDALKRAERERKAHANPVLAELAHTPGASAPARRHWRNYLRSGGIALLVLIAGLLSWTMLRDRPRPVREAVTAAETPAPAATASAPVVIPGTEAVASLDDLSDESAEEMEAESGLRPALPETTTPTPVLPQPALPRAETPSATPSASAGDNVSTPPAAGTAPAATPPEPTPADDGASASLPKAPAAKEIPSVLTQPAPMRKLREMPPDYRADFPALSVEVHVYERETARRMVMINGRRYHEGDRLAEGPLVVEIVGEGIVFEHRGEKVLYTLGR